MFIMTALYGFCFAAGIKAILEGSLEGGDKEMNIAERKMEKLVSQFFDWLTKVMRSNGWDLIIKSQSEGFIIDKGTKSSIDFNFKLTKYGDLFVEVYACEPYHTKIVDAMNGDPVMDIRKG